jgi:hypothetical protein
MEGSPGKLNIVVPSVGVAPLNVENERQALLALSR